MNPKEVEAQFSTLSNNHMGILGDAQLIIDKLRRTAMARDEARARLKTIESNIWVNAGTPDHPIDGKNEKLREAQFQLACDGTHDWVETTASLRRATADIEMMERDLAMNGKAVRAVELAMQFAIEQFQYLNTPRFYRDTTN